MHELFQLGLIAFDDAYPLQTAITNITISVNRNPNAPVFNPQVYTRSISEDYTLGFSLVQVEVSDDDGVGVILTFELGILIFNK